MLVRVDKKSSSWVWVGLLTTHLYQLEDRPMLADFDDFCLYLYVLVDDLWARVAPQYRRPGPPLTCSASELIPMVLAGECRGWDYETECVVAWQPQC